MSTNLPGSAPYSNADDTRRWVETYRVGKKVKPTLIVRAATDSNYINDQFIQLPAYGGNFAFTKSISNVVSPGQRLPGCLNWSVTESLENVVQSAQLTVLDALAQSRISTTITAFGVGTKNNTITSVGSMPAQWHSTTIRTQWVSDGNGIAQQLVGNLPINAYKDPSLSGNPYSQQFREDNLLYRIFEPEVIQVADLSNFPDPACPVAEAEGPNEWWDTDSFGSLKGVGAYYVLIDQEVMRVTKIDRATNRIFIVPGCRGSAGSITAHNVGATVQLLGFPPFNGRWSAYGYLMPEDFKINQSPMRPGTCWVSYEGYGIPGDYQVRGQKPGLSKVFDRRNNMCFTGYWFVQNPELTLDDTGVPQLQCTLQSAGFLLSEQKIDPDNIQRSRNVFYSWAKATFDDIGYNRKIPGDWFDFNVWDPVLPGAYPLTISTEYAQHKAFFDHMTDTDMGRQCEFCQQEWLDYVKQHESGKPTGAIREARAVGKHIYKESIRVFNKGGQFNAGPLKTFGRLMHALAAAAWENPLEGNSLGTRWTKIPNKLFTNLTTFENGRVWNGQLAYDTVGSTKGYDWSNPTHEDLWVHGARLPLKSPFTVQYDRQPWSQPMTDLADLNRMTYSITREGYPVFVPMGKKMRGIPAYSLVNDPGYNGPHAEAGNFVNKYGVETADTDVGMGEWHLAYGGSIDSYTHTIDSSSVLTLVYVSCQTAFGDEITFTIPAAGTGVATSNDKNMNMVAKTVLYSNKVGNKEGLVLTSGAQATDAVSLDNLLLGLDWNTHPASWGLQVKRGPDQLEQVDAQPPMPNPSGLSLYLESDDSKKDKGKKRTKKIQQLINFMMERRYIGPAVFDDNGTIVYPTQINEDSKFNKATDSGVKNIQQFLTGQSGINFVQQSGKYFFIGTGGVPTFGDKPGTWGQATYQGMQAWMSINSEYIKTDVWWYVQNGLPWDQYICAVTGMFIPERRDASDKNLWLIDQNALKTEAESWMKQFFKDAINYGNAIVDDSINKASQKVINTNMGDPRIQLGDVVWAKIPGYLAPQNSFGSYIAPFLNGIYITGITRTMDLQAGSYTASYQGYRYRGYFEQKLMTNASNYCSIHTQV